MRLLFAIAVAPSNKRRATSNARAASERAPRHLNYLISSYRPFARPTARLLVRARPRSAVDRYDRRRTCELGAADSNQWPANNSDGAQMIAQTSCERCVFVRLLRSIFHFGVITCVVSETTRAHALVGRRTSASDRRATRSNARTQCLPVSARETALGHERVAGRV